MNETVSILMMPVKRLKLIEINKRKTTSTTITFTTTTTTTRLSCVLGITTLVIAVNAAKHIKTRGRWS